MFGMGSPWWQVAGLVVDIAGFAILTFDILPEYLHHQAKSRIERAQVALSVLRWRRPVPTGAQGNFSPSWYDRLSRGDRNEFIDEFSEDVVAGGLEQQGADFLTVQLRRAIAELETLGMLMRTTTVQLDGPQITLTGLSRTENAKIDPLVQLYFKAQEELRSFDTAFFLRGRVPIWLGISAIVLGFVMQLWGTIPPVP